MDNYDDMMRLERPRYDDLPPMSVHDRAAQFSPFAALTGYDDAVGETARLVDCKRELDEDEINALNGSLNRLLDTLGEQPLITVTYFVPDERKSGGRYVRKTGVVRIFDSYTNELVFTDAVRIAVDDLSAVEFVSQDMDGMGE